MKVAPINSRRDDILDVMRGFAILLMIQMHLLINVRPNSVAAHNVLGSIGTLAAPFFLICSGMSFAYMRQRYLSQSKALRQVLIRRGVFLVCLATCLGIYHLDIRRMADWDVFTVIGTMYVLMAIRPKSFGFQANFAAVVLAVFLGEFIPMEGWTLLRGGSFPIIPFATYFLLGSLYVHAVLFPVRCRVHIAICLAAVSLLSSILLNQNIQILHLTRYDVWSVGGILLVVSLFILVDGSIRVLSKNLHFQVIVVPMVQFGIVSFSLYYIQYFFLILLPILIHVVTGQKFPILLSTLIWIVVLLVFSSLLYAGMRIWALYSYRWGLEWFMSNYISRRSLTSSKT